MKTGLYNKVNKPVSGSAENERYSQAVHVTNVGLVVNIVLTGFKFVAGFVGHSSAIVADAAHSLSDLMTDIAVLAGLRIAKKPRDSSHNYGHGKIETICAVFVGLALFVVAFGIFQAGLEKVLAFYHGESLPAPGWIAFFAAVISIISKEYLYRYTVKCGLELKSDAIIANAWHHRSDAFSSIGTMVGTGAAILLGGRWSVLDPLAAVVLSFFIFKVAADISYQNLNELVEASVDPMTLSRIETIIGSTEGVLGFHELKTRKIGNSTAADVHIEVDRSLDIVAAHEISTRVENRLQDLCGKNGHFSIHVEPCPAFKDYSPDLLKPDSESNNLNLARANKGRDFS